MAVLDAYGNSYSGGSAARSSSARSAATLAGMKKPYGGVHEIVAEARARVVESYTASQKFRIQRDDDRAFMEDQYSPDDRRSRLADEKPSLQVHTVEQALQSIMEDFRKAEPGFRVGPAAGGAGEEVAAIYNGLAQADMRDVRSQAALAQATQEQVAYGIAWLQWMAVPVSQSNPFDQRLVLRAARNDHVFDDPQDETLERSNMDWLIEVERMTIARRNARWPEAKGLEPTDFESYSPTSDWWFPAGTVGPEQDREVRVAYYYRRQYEDVELAIGHGWPEPKELAALTDEERLQVATGRAAVMKTKRPYVEFAVLDGEVPIMRPQRLPYSMIPYVRLVGQTVETNDDVEIPRGLAYYLKDTARWMSLTCSDVLTKQVFSSADFFLVSNENDTGELDNPRAPGTKHYNALADDGNGNMIKLDPPIYHSTNPAIESGIAVTQLVRELQGVASGAADAPTREDTARVSSVQVLDRLDRREAIGRRTYVWWLVTISMRQLGESWLDMSGIYGRKGRFVHVAGDTITDADQGAIIGVPFYRDNEGVPVPLPGLADDIDRIPNRDAPDDPEMAHNVIRFDPDKAKVKVTTYSGITETSGTDAALEVMLNLMATSPEVSQALSVPVVKAAASRYPSLDGAVDRVEAAFPAPAGKDVSAKDAPRVVAQLRAELQQVTVERDEARQLADQTQAAKDIEQIRAASKEAVVRMQEENKRFLKELEAKMKVGMEVGKQAHETTLQDDQQDHELVLEGVKRRTAVEVAKAKPKPAAPAGGKTSGGKRK